MKLKTAGFDYRKSVSARASRMNPNTVRTFFNMVEKIATKNNLSGTFGNIFKIDESGIQLNNQPDIIITQSGSTSVHDLTSG
jgi:hypothetical protein